MPLLLLLGLFDLMVGAALTILTIFPVHSGGLLFYIGLIALFKGLWSIITAAAAGFYFDILGVFDLLAGVFLLLLINGIVFGFFIYIGILVILKALYSILIFMIKP